MDIQLEGCERDGRKGKMRQCGRQVKRKGRKKEKERELKRERGETNGSREVNIEERMEEEWYSVGRRHERSVRGREGGTDLHGYGMGVDVR